MKTLKNLMYYSFMALAILATSCSTDGEDGMDGAQGEQGIAGQDGEDGNANVIGVTIDPFPSWTEGIYLGQEANFVEIDEPLLTEEVANDALVLAYFQLSNNNAWFPMTYAFIFDDGDNEVITFTYEQNNITVYAFNSAGPLNAGITRIRYFIIPTSDAGRSQGSTKENLLLDLKTAGVDATNYEEVANYFKLL